MAGVESPHHRPFKDAELVNALTLMGIDWVQ
jgi:hypothetical protein